MKKAYQKPMVYAEEFQLYEHISGNCYVNKDAHVQAGFITKSTCLYWDDNIAMYNYHGNCKAAMDMWLDPDLGMSGDDETTWGQACYNAFSDYNMAFVS